MKHLLTRFELAAMFDQPGPDHVALARRYLDVSQAGLAKRLNVSSGTVGDWETGRTTIRPEHAAKIAGLLRSPPRRGG